YGVGLFKGLHRMRLGDAENDYLLLHYAGGDKLYLPVDRLSLIQRYKSSEGESPAPDRLGGGQWQAGKEKARKAIEKIAADLVEMYALRKVVKGFHYGPVNGMYREFEASFGFEETPDQSRAIEEVLADMEKPEPMDRLVCGDVGFGKTEVALRAAFRAALEGRQAALLCPTTVLAEQHYQTFRGRLAPFPVNVGMLSRFVTRSKQKEVLQAAARGQIDILIGTHRLLSKDVDLPKLGLLILDEEQRFGVRHKERLKAMRKNIDVLTLTATPIPRTLQLSLSGIRELSVIETPPLERKPVATALIDRDDNALRGIVERELARQGQVFWVYNRVQGLERVAEYVRKLTPEARIGIAHGQMGESALEQTMHRFWHGELDVLVCTAIIESGLDFPRANTLVVDQAQMFGLGQLYQLRGRVGRSDRQAYAVFVTPDPDRLPEQARQRLRIILDLDYLGAGFQVAMEDLRLRGAGNILGESQTGHINRIGLDLFLEMLEEAVAGLKGQPVQTHQETELTLGVPAFIPEDYMTDNRERLRYYKLLSSAPDEDSRRDAVFEMRDRFGPLPVEAENFVAVLAFKRYLTDIGVQKADIFSDKLRLAFAGNAAVDPAALVDFVQQERGRGLNVRLQPPAVLELPLSGERLDQALARAGTLLATLEKTSADTTSS
ncbi:transcription-repair coupling factor, partial [Desulfovibrio sp. OttesenSCG-928-G11]|nr:transcription-repair coupling factor [Desulfovibrio sp. OttesenSCG-928-G11]